MKKLLGLETRVKSLGVLGICELGPIIYFIRRNEGAYFLSFLL